MSSWKYKRGEWTEIDDLLPWLDGETWEDSLRRSGYYQHVCVCFDGEAVEHVFIDDFPSMMEFLRDFSPLFTQRELEFQISDKGDQGSRKQLLIEIRSF
jgi:hypothetical protein